MIKQIKKTSDVDEVNRLLDNGWLLIAESIDEFVLGAPEKVWEYEKGSDESGRIRVTDLSNFERNI